MSVAVVTLGPQGIIRDIDKAIDYQMCCFFWSKFSQSTLYRGRVTSLTKIIQMNSTDGTGLRVDIENKLSVFLRRTFPGVQVVVTEEDGGDDPSIKLQINAIVSTESDVSANPVSVGYSLLVRDSKLKELINLSNGVTLISR